MNLDVRSLFSPSDRAVPQFHLLLAVVALSKIIICHGGSSSSSSSSSSSISTYNQSTLFQLTSGSSIPLLGTGIGNLPHEEIVQVIHNQLDAGIRLVDTSRASNNEKILAEAIAKYNGQAGALRGGNTGSDPLHVVTKIWYTHLGYERTKISIEESLADLQLVSTSSGESSQRQIYVHMLLHWPRCNDDIEWMHCQEEERNLPQRIKDAGPPPQENSFIDSWKALEASISNFLYIVRMHFDFSAQSSSSVSPSIDN